MCPWANNFTASASSKAVGSVIVVRSSQVWLRMNLDVVKKQPGSVNLQEKNTQLKEGRELLLNFELLAEVVTCCRSVLTLQNGFSSRELISEVWSGKKLLSGNCFAPAWPHLCWTGAFVAVTLLGFCHTYSWRIDQHLLLPAPKRGENMELLVCTLSDNCYGWLLPSIYTKQEVELRWALSSLANSYTTKSQQAKISKNWGYWGVC